MMDDTVDTADLVYRLHKRAETRRNIPHRKSVIEGAPDRLAELLDEAGKEITKLRYDLEGYKAAAESLQQDVYTLTDEDG